jgi:hypothetical protein
MTVVGCAELKSSRLIREPVTVISSSERGAS